VSRPRRALRAEAAQWPLDAGITVVLFAGLGGACAGLEDAGCPVAVANNHDEVALAAHAALHPHTRHVRGDIFDVDPIAATHGRRVKLLWASPDCRDHSVAKGGAPRSPRVRSLPWQVCRWVGKTRPEIVFVENVREIRGWGPLVAKRDRATGRVLKLDGSVAARGERVPVWQQQLVRDPRRTGRSFRRWVAHLRGLGGAYEDRDLNCADYGVPTARRRFFAVARFDGQPIRWPARTHAPRLQAPALSLKPWRAAAEIIDWSRPIPSIFDRKRPLAEATLRRIAVGLRRYVIEAREPFLISVTHQGSNRAHSGAEPLPTLTTAHRGEFAVIAPSLVQTGYGEAPGQAPRALDLSEPIGTQVAGGAKHALIAAFFAQHNLGAVGFPATSPISTLTTLGTQQQVCAAFLSKFQQNSPGQPAAAPLDTVMAGATRFAAVAAFLTKYYGEGGTGQEAGVPLHALTTLARFGVVTVTIQGEPWIIADIGMRMLEPAEAAAAHELRLPDSITLNGVRRPLTKSESMRLIGNSVPRRMARLLAEANVVHALTHPRQEAA
jgi:DNA (cytosine-5)-methyltransferase 1